MLPFILSCSQLSLELSSCEALHDVSLHYISRCIDHLTLSSALMPLRLTRAKPGRACKSVLSLDISLSDNFTSRGVSAVLEVKLSASMVSRCPHCLAYQGEAAVSRRVVRSSPPWTFWASRAWVRRTNSSFRNFNFIRTVPDALSTYVSRRRGNAVLAIEFAKPLRCRLQNS